MLTIQIRESESEPQQIFWKINCVSLEYLKLTSSNWSTGLPNFSHSGKASFTTPSSSTACKTGLKNYNLIKNFC
jgi:hypothetical protein